MTVAAKIGAKVRHWRAGAVRARQLAFAALQEIFDERAYASFLVQRHLQPSSGSYAAFRKEHEQSKARRPRCC